ncbi:MAG TPA: PadR family transcriptional regulator [Bryobacteraceae bacterium]|nr:PadR family transcriptional regulator [Bryobacteraceae bacterium]
MPERHYLGEFELLVMLTVIRLDDEAYGVPISREIEEATGRGVAFGTVYSTLERLEKKGFVSSRLGDATPERGGRAKRYFRATPTGLRTVRETKQSLTKLWQGIRLLEGGAA